MGLDSTLLPDAQRAIVDDNIMFAVCPVDANVGDIVVIL
jgi:hypothetical protein